MLRSFLIGMAFTFDTAILFAQSATSPLATNVQRLQFGDAVDRSHAAKALGELGASAAPAASHLVQALRDPDPFVTRAATDALCRIGVAATPPLLRALEGGDARWRHHAAVALSRIGPTDPVAVKALIKSLKVDPSAEVRRRAALALDKGGKPGDGVLTALIGALKDCDSTVRISAAVALGDFGAEAKDATGPLSDLLKGDDSKLNKAARDALHKIAPTMHRP
jgi:HEAT repeat protein